MKRELRAFVCLAVCLLMQAVSVFPHHHHNHLICIHDDLTEQSAEESPLHEEHSQGHDCCGHGCCAGCATHILTSYENISHEDCLPDYTFFTLIYNLSDQFHDFFLDFGNDEKGEAVYLERLHDTLLSGALSLRAPPAG